MTGTFGYWYLTGMKYPMFDCFYLTVITITTIGYSEVIDQAHYPNARVLTVFLAFAGIGLLTYFVTSISAIVVEGQLKESYKKRKMESLLKKNRKSLYYMRHWEAFCSSYGRVDTNPKRQCVH